MTAATELMAGYSVLDRYMARRAQKSKSPELFDGDGNARWITIGGEPGADGKKQGGHPVKISGDGKMLTGKFAGQTLGQAFGKDKKSESKPAEAEKPPQKPKTSGSLPEGWSESKPGGMATNKNGDIVDREIKGGKWFVIHDGPKLDGFDSREEALEALKNHKPEKKEPKNPEKNPETKQPDQPKSDGVPRVTQDQLGDGSDGTYDQMHAGLASEFVQSRVVQGMKGIEGREYGMFQHPSGKWQMVSRPAKKPANPQPKSESPKPTDPGSKLTGLGGDSSEPESAAASFDKAISSGGTPREAAKKAQKQADKDYAYARASEIGNAGEDLKGSARHKVNSWRGLEQAEKDGTASELMTRKHLLKIEPHKLSATIDSKSAMSHLAAHLAIAAFPDSPGGYPSNYDKYRNRDGSPLAPPASAEKLRQQYLSAYMAIKNTAEEAAKKHVDPRDALKEIHQEVSKQIKLCRGLPADAKGLAVLDATDHYNPIANALVSLANRCSGSGRKSTDFMSRIMELTKLAKQKLGDTPSVEHLDLMKNAAIGVMEGKSLAKAIGVESEGAEGSKRLDPSEMYVQVASRTGGRDLSSVTNNANKAVKHMVESMGLRGVQWGNSVSDDERKHHAAKSVEALTDLADTLGLHPKDITLDGKLGLAIGARGRGGAVAHYEPGTQVINLTRKNGVGSLSHEWAHGFDHYLSNFRNGEFKGEPQMMSDRADRTHTVTLSTPGGYTSEIDEDAANRHLNSASKHKVEPLKDLELRKSFQQLAKQQSGYRTRLSSHLRSLVKTGLMSHEKARDYWQSEPEIFARTFERYIQHKLESSGKKNTYLAGIETKGHKAGGLWPTDEEVSDMAPAFDKLFLEYRKHKHGSPDPIKYSRAKAMQELMVSWGFYPNVEQYARKSPKSSPGQMTFDDQDGGKWITIGGESGADGGKHGGHPVYIGKDGEMKTGKFAGQKLDEAFGKGKKSEQATGPSDKSPELSKSPESQKESSRKRSELEGKLFDLSQKKYDRNEQPGPWKEINDQKRAIKDQLKNLMVSEPGELGGNPIKQSDLIAAAQTSKPQESDPIRRAIIESGGHENNSANALDEIRRKLYNGPLTPTHGEIRKAMEDMKNEAGQQPAKLDELNAPTKSGAFEAFNAKSVVDEMRKSGKSLVQFAKEKNLTPEQRKAAFEEFASQNEQALAPKPPSEARAAAMAKRMQNDAKPAAKDQQEHAVYSPKTMADYEAMPPYSIYKQNNKFFVKLQPFDRLVGDTIFSSEKEAKEESEREKSNANKKAQITKESADKEAADQKRKQEGIDAYKGFLKDNPMKFGKTKAALDKQIRHDGTVKTKRQWIEDLHKDGWSPGDGNELLDPKDSTVSYDLTITEMGYFKHLQNDAKPAPTAAARSPGLTMDTRPNESAKPNDQLGMFGDVANAPLGAKSLSPGGETRGKQQSLFDSKGDPDQMLMFDDGVTPEDRVMKFGRSGSIRDHAAELVRYWGLSVDSLGESVKYAAPSESQAEAGNYKMGHIRLHGLEISIETAKGKRRRPEWPPMPCDYGYIRGTVGKDKDHVDVFVGPNKKSELVVVVDQVNQNGKFDEHKVLLGFSNKESAIKYYKMAYTSDWKVGPVTVMTIGQFNAWLENGNQRKPVEKQVSRYSLRN